MTREPAERSCRTMVCWLQEMYMWRHEPWNLDIWYGRPSPLDLALHFNANMTLLPAA